MAFIQLAQGKKEKRVKSLEETLWNLPLLDMIHSLNLIEDFDEEVTRAIWRAKDRVRIEEWSLRLEKRRLTRRQFLEFRLLANGINPAAINADLFKNHDV